MSIYEQYDKSELHELVGYDEQEDPPEKQFSITVCIISLACFAVVKTMDAFAAIKRLFTRTTGNNSRA